MNKRQVGILLAAVIALPIGVIAAAFMTPPKPNQRDFPSELAFLWQLDPHPTTDFESYSSGSGSGWHRVINFNFKMGTVGAIRLVKQHITPHNGWRDEASLDITGHGDTFSFRATKAIGKTKNAIQAEVEPNYSDSYVMLVDRRTDSSIIVLLLQQLKESL